MSRGTFQGTMKRMSREWKSHDYRTSLGRVELFKRFGDTAEGQHEIKSRLGNKQRLTVREMGIGKSPVAISNRVDAVSLS